MAYETTAEIINDAAIELGLVSAPITNPWASTNPAIAQLLRCLKAEGRHQCLAYQWPHLQASYTFSTVDGTSAYDIPSYYLGVITGDTAWDRTQNRQLIGPLNPQQWEALQAGTVSGMVDSAFRIQGGYFHIYPTPSSVRLIAYSINISWWVLGAGGVTLDDSIGDEPDESLSGTDVLFFDSRLLVCGTKLRWLLQKGFSSQAAHDEYERVLENVRGGAIVGKTLTLTNSPRSSFPFIPETGFGD